MSLFIYHTLTHSLGRMSERKVARTRERLLLLGDHLTILAFYLLVLILSLRKLWGFILYGFPKKIFVSIVSCFLIDVLVILSVKDPKIIMLA